MYKTRNNIPYYYTYFRILFFRFFYKKMFFIVMDIDVICKFRNKSNLIIKNSKNVKSISTKYNKKKYKFMMNEIWDNNITYNDIYSYFCKNSVNYKDKNIILFGYSGSGKTFTMMNILKEIINNNIDNKIKYTISCFQIYNNNIYDILDNNKQLKFFKNDILIIKDISKLQFESFDELSDIITNNRKCSKTYNNDVSSRSCLIIKINSIISTYNIIDMPGQETANINNNINIQNEAKNINLSMLALKNCILSYYQKKKYIPFRDNLLTLYLKKMFISICKVYFICTINSDNKIFYQLDSIKYASCLVHPKKNINNNITKLLLEYSLYITSIGLNNCEDNNIFKQLKNNDYCNINHINKMLNSNIEVINEFKKKINCFLEKIKK